MNSFHSFPWQVGSRFAIGDGGVQESGFLVRRFGVSLREAGFTAPIPLAAQCGPCGGPLATKWELLRDNFGYSTNRTETNRIPTGQRTIALVHESTA